jgi:uncharacterized membrane protein required for colicin V production
MNAWNVWLHSLNGLDWAVLVILTLGFTIGYTRGLVGMLVSVAGLLVALWAAVYFYKDAAPWLLQVITLPAFESYAKYEFIVKGLNLEKYVSQAIAFALIFFGVKLLFLIISRLLTIFTKMPGIKTVNQFTGALLGLTEAAVIIVIAVNVMTVVPNDDVQRLLSHSSVSAFIIEDSPIAAGKLQEMWK